MSTHIYVIEYYKTQHEDIADIKKYKIIRETEMNIITESNGGLRYLRFPKKNLDAIKFQQKTSKNRVQYTVATMSNDLTKYIDLFREASDVSFAELMEFKRKREDGYYARFKARLAEESEDR